MSFTEAAQAIPSLITRFDPAHTRAAWNLLLSDLRALNIPPVPGEPTVDAFTIWHDYVSEHGTTNDHVLTLTLTSLTFTLVRSKK